MYDFDLRKDLRLETMRKEKVPKISSQMVGLDVDKSDGTGSVRLEITNDRE